MNRQSDSPRLPFPERITQSEALAPLRALPQWVCYKNVVRPAMKKRKAHIDKVPINPRTGELADTTIPETWTSYEEAVAGLTRWPVNGIGFVFTKISKVVGCDLDNAGNVRTGHLDALAQEMIATLDTYAEWSPSGTGIHLLAFGGPLPPEGRVKDYCGHRIEVYDSERFFTVTGLHVNGTPQALGDRPEEILAFHSRVFGKITSQGNGEIPAPDRPTAPPPPADTDAALLERMFQSKNGDRIRHLWNGGAPKDGDTSASGGDFALCCELAWWSNGNGTHMERLFKQSPRMQAAGKKRRAYLARTIKKAITAWRKDRPPDPTEPLSSANETAGAEPHEDAAPEPDAPSAQAKERTATPFTIANVEAVVREWLLLPALAVVRLLAAIFLVNRLEYDPLWAFIVGPPSTGKTELLNALGGMREVYPLSSLTAQTFVSGYRDHKTPDLLPQITGKVVVFKDFGTVLTMHRDARQEVLAQLREIYDGRFDKDFGTGKRFRWQGKIGFLAGVTEVIDTHYAVYQVLGERFLQYRMPGVDRREQARFALGKRGQEKSMRAALQRAFATFFAGRQWPALSTVTVPAAAADALVAFACFTSAARSGVIRESYSTREIELAPEPEGPARIAKQLSALALGLALVTGENTVTTQTLALVAKVALDCLPKLRLAVLSALYRGAAEPTTSAIAEQIGHPTITARRALEDLAAIGIIKRAAGSHERDAHRWYLTESTEADFATILHCAGADHEKQPE